MSDAAAARAGPRSRVGPARRREMMSRLGFAAGPARPSLTPLHPDDRTDLERMLERWKPFL